MSAEKKYDAFICCNEADLLLVTQIAEHLDDPALETGDRKRMKILRVDPNKDIPVKTVVLLLNRALDIHREGRIAAG